MVDEVARDFRLEQPLRGNGHDPLIALEDSAEARGRKSVVQALLNLLETAEPEAGISSAAKKGNYL